LIITCYINYFDINWIKNIHSTSKTQVCT
jgi:hypothetical protein